MDSMLNALANLPWWAWAIVFLALVAIRDVFVQKNHTISHNFPIVGHLRYWLESIGPEMRQYFVANNREELPFNRIEKVGSMPRRRRKTIMKALERTGIFMHINIFLSRTG